jgi:hypothetical protein
MCPWRHSNVWTRNRVRVLNDDVFELMSKATSTPLSRSSSSELPNKETIGSPLALVNAPQIRPRKERIERSLGSPL